VSIELGNPTLKFCPDFPPGAASGFMDACAEDAVEVYPSARSANSLGPPRGQRLSHQGDAESRAEMCRVSHPALAASTKSRALQTAAKSFFLAPTFQPPPRKKPIRRRQTKPGGQTFTCDETFLRPPQTPRPDLLRPPAHPPHVAVALAGNRLPRASSAPTRLRLRKMQTLLAWSRWC
jgi:hypothetical protein